MVEYGRISMEYGWWNDLKDFIGFEKKLWLEKGCDWKKVVTGKKSTSRACAYVS